MDESKYLITDTRNGLKDLTADIAHISPIGDLVEVVFKNSGKKFRYSRKNINIASNPKTIDADVIIDGHITLGTEKKLLFGKILKVFLPNHSKPQLHYGNFRILNSRIKNALEYFYRVAQQVKTIPSEAPHESANTIVEEAIAGINDVQEKSPLFSYLTGDVQPLQNVSSDLIFPFQCNESQLKAVEQTFSNRLSLIQGPPGTGKTQTILNIAMNAILQNKSVAIVSNNNSAIKNVVEKLKSTDELDFMVALLGNRENQEFFFYNQPKYPNWLRDDQKLPHDVGGQLRSLRAEIKQLFVDQNILKQKISEEKSWSVEFAKFLECYPHVRQVKDLDIPSHVILDIFAKCNLISIRNKKISFWFKLWNVIFCRRWSFSFWNRPVDDVLVALKNIFYRKKLFELNLEIARLSKKIANADLEDKHKRLNQLSLQFLKAKLQKKYRYAKSERKKFQKYDLRTADFLYEYPILLSTTFMIKTFSPKSGFDLLIMDEASQVDICTGIAALSCAKNAVIVGDDKQLPCVITEQDEHKLSELNKSAKIDKKYLYLPGQSILSSIKQAVPDVPNTTLLEHYRCDPLIIEFCNKMFYENKLIIHSQWHDTPSLHVIFTAEGNHARGHLNRRQGQEINRLKQELIKNRGFSEESIAVCTPYRLQAENIGASTVHKLQGREKDVIIMSTVDNIISDFVADKRLVNVAVSRAKKEFYLVVSSSNKNWDNCIGDLVNYIKYYDPSGKSISYGNITSVFDLLYNEYQNLNIDRHQQKYLFDSPAEEIIYDVLSEIIRTNDIDCRYSFKMHIPLREIFKQADDLSDDESKYLSNANTHVDFLIYERLGKTPRFAIEVDGYNYHKTGTRQAERDKLKNSIFDKRKIPLLRLSTTDSGERKRITDFIFGNKNQLSF